MWKWIAATVVILLVMGIGGFLWMMKGPDVSRFETLRNPRITLKADTQVLEIPFEVNSAGLAKVFGVLMRTYFGLSGVPKGPGMGAPAARYENLPDMSLPAAQRAQALAQVTWKGSAGIPVPGTVKELPAGAGTPEFTPRLGFWKYGEVAEILHVGPYENEPPTIKKLKDYLTAQGYEIAGLHEEEYLRGPGMLFSNPKNYYTIIRYPVRKKAAPPQGENPR